MDWLNSVYPDTVRSVTRHGTDYEIMTTLPDDAGRRAAEICVQLAINVLGGLRADPTIAVYSINEAPIAEGFTSGVGCSPL